MLELVRKVRHTTHNRVALHEAFVRTFSEKPKTIITCAVSARNPTALTLANKLGSL